MFVVILAEACRPFLTRLQSMRSLIQELLPRCCQLFLALAENIMKPDKIPQTAGDIAMLNLKDSSLFKAASEATYMKTLSKTLEGLDKAEKSKLADEFLAACKAQLEYLKDHLPSKAGCCSVSSLPTLATGSYQIFRIGVILWPTYSRGSVILREPRLQ